MLDTLLQWLDSIDSTILLTINSHHTPALDTIMWLVSDKWFWTPLYILLIALICRRVSFTCAMFILLAVITLIIITDRGCADLIKPLVGRLRPSSPDNPLSVMLTYVNGYRGGHYGFPSCHAANSFALAVFLSLFFKNRHTTIALLCWAFLISWSRMYLGVHYPGDILGGAIIGSGIAVVIYRLYRYLTEFCTRWASCR